jgi:hypothetical protein
MRITTSLATQNCDFPEKQLGDLPERMQEIPAQNH